MVREIRGGALPNDLVGGPGFGEEVRIFGLGGDDRITVTSGQGIVTAYGNSGDDRIDITPGIAMTVYALGGPGDDRLFTRAFVSGRPITLDGGAGDDTIIALASSVSERLIGGDGNDTLIGGGGGAHPGDHLYGGRGRDVMTGGSNGDIFKFS